MPDRNTTRHLTGLYAASDDPWDHRTSPYESAKYAATLDAIGGPFVHALEIGCGNGTLARRLAPLCQQLTLVELIPAAADLARQAVPTATVLQGAAPDILPDIRPDLILLSEVLYFLTGDEIARLGAWILAHSTGPVVAVNWTGPTDEVLDGPRAVALLARVLGPADTTHHDRFRIDVFKEPAPAATR